MAEIFHSGSKQGHEAPGPVDPAYIKSAGQAWAPSGVEGFLLKVLFESPDGRHRTWLMKVEAGAFAPLHAHDDLEQVLVLEGSFYDQHRTYGPGDFVIRRAGEDHSAGSRDGAVILLVYSPDM